MKQFWKTLLLATLMIGLYYGGRYVYFRPSFSGGEVLPAITGTLLNGTPFQLSELRGSYVLVDFWGSWCPPCQRENPQLVNLYQRYQHTTFTDAAGFEIVSIGIERDREAWEAAIQRYQLDWKYHLLDTNDNLRFFNGDIATEFGVRAVPTKYLLNGKGQIVLINPTFSEITTFLDQRARAVIGLRVGE